MFLIEYYSSFHLQCPPFPPLPKITGHADIFLMFLTQSEAMGSCQPLQCCFHKNIFLFAKEDPLPEEPLSPQGREQLLLSIMGLSPLIKHPQPQSKDENKALCQPFRRWRGWRLWKKQHLSPTVDLGLSFNKIK